MDVDSANGITTNDTGMPPDQNPQQHSWATSKPQVQEQPTRTFASVGTITEKGGRPATSLLEVEGLGVAGAARVMQVAWNPADPAVLATTGEGLCRLWNLSKGAPQQYKDLLEDAEHTIVTAAAWSDDAEIFAVATYQMETGPNAASWTTFSKDGVEQDSLPLSHPVASMKWHPDGTRILGIGEEVIIWDLDSESMLDPLKAADWVWDATWTEDNDFWLAGNGGLHHAALTPSSGIEVRHHYSDADPSRHWQLIRSFPHRHAGPVIASASLTTSSLWLPTLNIKSHDIHPEGEITGMEFSPHHYESSSSPTVMPILATSSSDPHASVKIWTIDAANRQLQCMHTLSLGRTRPVMALSFTSDGFLVAAAGYDRILMWNPDQGGDSALGKKVVWKAEELEMVEWNGVKRAREILGSANGNGNGNGNGNPNGSGNSNGNGVDRGQVKSEEDEEEDDVDIGSGDVHSLSWDADNRKLAFGLGSQVRSALMEALLIPTLWY